MASVSRIREFALRQNRLKQLLSYDQETGTFTRKVNGSRYKAGDIAGASDGNGYLVICIDGFDYRAHRLAWLYVHGVWPKAQIDHRNRCKSDNRILNLREATGGQNRVNRCLPKKPASEFRGVSRISAFSWAARLQKDSQTIFVGCFPSPVQAAHAYDAAARRLFGEFAVLNFQAEG